MPRQPTITSSMMISISTGEVPTYDLIASASLPCMEFTADCQRKVGSTINLKKKKSQLKLQHTGLSTQHTAHSTQHTTHNTQHTTHNTTHKQQTPQVFGSNVHCMCRTFRLINDKSQRDV